MFQGSLQKSSPPASIKYVAEVLNELISGLGTFGTDLRSDITKFGTAGTGIHNELAGIRNSIGFMNEGVRTFRKVVEVFRQALTCMKSEN